MSTTSTSTRFISIEPKLDATNFHGWKQKITLTLKSRRLWGIVSGSEAKPTANAAAITSWEERDQDALAQIVLNISDAHLSITSAVSTSADAWKAILAEFQPKRLIAQAVATQAFWDLKYTDGADMRAHVNRLRELRDEAVAAGATMADETLLMRMIASLPPSRNPLIGSLDHSKMTSNDLIARLLSEDTRRNQQSSTNDDIALRTGGKPHGRSRGNKSSDDRKTRTKKGDCFNCGKPGHFANECRSAPNRSRTQSHCANVTDTLSDDDDDTVGLIVNHQAYAARVDRDDRDLWVVSSGPVFCLL